MMISLLIVLWILPGIVTVFIQLKAEREERKRIQGTEYSYNTLGDLAFAILMGAFGFVGLIGVCVVVYQDVIIKFFDKKL